jgi:AcrR family transcriptional regulator
VGRGFVADDLRAGASRKPRADGQRNRERLLEAAKPALASRGFSASLDEIAREAGVGIGTLYRHFPTRDSLVQAVYLNETQHLAAAAAQLAEVYGPVEALRAWMRLFVEYIATKQVMAEMLKSLPGGTSDLYATSTAQISAAVNLLVDRAVASGDIQLGLDPMDLLRALAGVAHAGAEPHWEQKAKRLVDILLAGLRIRDADS